MEIWKDVVNYEDSYQVSNLGRVRTKDRWINTGTSKRFLKSQILKGDVNRHGYINYRLWKNNKLLNKLGHRLVAEHFLVNLENKKEVNHKNGIKSDNRLENLEWNTRSENTTHAFKTGLEKPKKSLITQDIFEKIVSEINGGRKKSDVLKKYNCTRRVFEYRIKFGYRY